MKKTCKVIELIEYSNLQLIRTDEFATKDFKIGICAMVEHILHVSGNYSGFRFLKNDDSEVNTLGYYSRQYYINNKLLK